MPGRLYTCRKLEMVVSDNWDFYYCRVDNKPASMYLDLDAVQVGPVEGLPTMAFIRLRMLNPLPDGLSSPEEFGTLCAVEDALNDQVAGEQAAYVGRCTSNGFRDFFFYVAPDVDWGRVVAACMEPFVDYVYEVGTRDDPKWSTYFNYLYPSQRDGQSIENRRVCKALEEHGDTLKEPREIDHWLNFGNEDDLCAFIDAAERIGFQVREQALEPDEDDRYVLQVFRTDVPGYASIDAVTLPLFDLAVANNGVYEGWESVVVQ